MPVDLLVSTLVTLTSPVPSSTLTSPLSLPTDVPPPLPPPSMISLPPPPHYPPTDVATNPSTPTSPLHDPRPPHTTLVCVGVTVWSPIQFHRPSPAARRLPRVTPRADTGSLHRLLPSCRGKNLSLTFEDSHRTQQDLVPLQRWDGDGQKVKLNDLYLADLSGDQLDGEEDLGGRMHGLCHLEWLLRDRAFMTEWTKLLRDLPHSRGPRQIC